MKNKGYAFTVRRITKHLQSHYREHGREGYILLFDFSKFFDNISHVLIKKVLHKEITDEKLIKITEHFIDAFGDIGMGLGSQISQVLALVSANPLDHFIKETLRIKRYGRYMDDGYLIHKSKSYLQKCLEGIKAVCEELGIKLNQKKTQIVKLSHGFTWLKIRFFITETGKVIKKMCKASITRMRVKLKKLHRKWLEGKIELADIWTSWQSWKSYADNFKSYHTVQNMWTLFCQLFYSGDSHNAVPT